MRIYPIIFFLLSMFPKMNAQQSPDILRDSMLIEINRAFKLFEQSKYAECIELNTKIIEYALNTKDTILLARSYAAVGNSYYYISRDSVSFYYLFKAKDLFLKVKDTFNLVIAYNDIGVNYKDFDSIEKASHYFQKAVNLAYKGGYEQDLIYPLANIADVDIRFKNNYLKGIENSFKALYHINKLEGYGDKRLIAEIYQQLTYAYHKLKDEKNKQLYFKKCEEFSTKNGFVEVLSDLYEDESKLYMDDQNYKTAYSLLKKHTVLKDSLTKIKEYEKAKQIEADNFLRENKEKLIIANKEKEFQKKNVKKARTYNILLLLFSIGLISSLYFIYRNNKKLNAAKEKAEQLSKVKSNFYSEISHELRTPLYAVIELSRLLLNENVNSNHKEYLESLNFSGNHLLSLINNVLELNKIESGQMNLQKLDFKLKNLISNIIESLEYAISDSGNKVHLDYDDMIPVLLEGDSLKLAQVFINLISNAIKFTNDGNIFITIRLIDNLNDKVKIFFEIRDDGLGISKEKQTEVFEEFYQENTKTNKSYKGTGLGLSIVKRIITAMNSQISIESALGKGTAFNFELVFSKIDQNGQETTAHKKLLNNIEGKKMLVVDDNKINRLVTKKILNQYDVIVKTVDSGKKAIELVREEDFDCILMDLNMPELDGYETTSFIRDFNKKIPIIALTAASSEEVELNITHSGMNDFVIKPFITLDFIETIYRNLEFL